MALAEECTGSLMNCPKVDQLQNPDDPGTVQISSPLSEVTFLRFATVHLEIPNNGMCMKTAADPDDPVV